MQCLDAFVVGLATNDGAFLGGIDIGGSYWDMAHGIDLDAGNTTRAVRVAGTTYSPTLTIGGGDPHAPVLYYEEQSSDNIWIATIEVKCLDPGLGILSMQQMRFILFIPLPSNYFQCAAQSTPSPSVAPVTTAPTPAPTADGTVAPIDTLDEDDDQRTKQIYLGLGI